MEIEVKAAQAAELMGVTIQHIRRMAKFGKLAAVQRLNALNRPEYLIPLASLPPEAQQRFYAQQPVAETVQTAKETTEPPPRKALDEFTAAERGEIDFWMDTVKRWQAYRARPGVKSKAEVDKAFVTLMQLEHPERSISTDILYRKWRFVREDDMEGLVDGRGKARRGQSEFDPDVLRVFRSFYLQEVKNPNIAQCIQYTEEYLQEYYPQLLPLPSYSTFRRAALAIPEQVFDLAVGGNKQFYDNSSLYIKRNYENLLAGDCWVADNHTLDIMSRGPDGGDPHRLYLTAFMDMRSGIFVGWLVSDSPSSQSTLYALRRGIMAYGIPKYILVDNGREFLTYDIGGRGHRAKKVLANGEAPFVPPGVFKRLGIEMKNAIVHNARAKPVERRFDDIKEQFSMLWETFTGGNILEKPECLKRILKNNRVPTDAEVIETMDLMIEGYFNQQIYHGAVKADHGKTKLEVFNTRRGVMRTASEEDLRLLLMRSTRKQKVGRRGVKVVVHGVQLDYFTHDFLAHYMGKEVYVRYDPDALETCRAYTLEDSFICELPQDTVTTLDVFSNEEDVRAAIKLEREHKKHVQAIAESYVMPGIDRRTALGLMKKKAERGLANAPQVKPAKAIKLERVVENPLLQAVGDVDVAQMNRNFILQHGGLDDE